MKKKEDMKFSSLLKNIIVENSRLEFLVKKFTQPREKKGKKLPPILKKEELMTLVKADPTSVSTEGGDIKKVGKYAQWILKQFLKIEPSVQAKYGTDEFKIEKEEKIRLFFEDLYKITQDLEKFDKFKNKLEQADRDINTLSIDKLNSLMMPFSLEKTKASKDEKKEASKTYRHPGGEIIFRGNKWTVVRISDTGELGKDAACFYGGSDKKPGAGESAWCTSSPGGGMFNHYIKSGPLYVILPNEPEEFMSGGPKTGEISGLPARRYQFHFPSNQYMDANDRQINLIEFLQNNPELKEVFKPEFAKSLSKGEKGNRVVLNYPSDSASKFVMLYGFDEFFESLPENLERFEFTKGRGRYGEDDDVSVDLKIPSSIGRFKNLDALHLEGVIDELPKEISQLKNLQFLSLPNNKNLKEIPDFVADLPNLQIVNLGDSNPNVKISQKVLDKANDDSNDFFLLK